METLGWRNGLMRHRLPPQPDEWIDRRMPVRFHFEGVEYAGYAGDTISSALWASGVRLLGRSFKYHRPRGIYSLANHDCNALMEDGTNINIRADITPIKEGANYWAVNTFGGLLRDKAQILDRLSAFLPVGFYYKTFHKPRWLFPFHERQMRRLAGLGTINPNRPRLHTPKAYDFCDVLVIGAGPAGLSAAIAAAERGAQVVLVDENARPGGSLTYQWARDPATREQLRQLLERALSLPHLDIRTSTVAAGYYTDHWIALVDEERLTKMRAQSVVIATGCFEQPAIFGNNDLPGVMLASAAQRLIYRYAVRPFEQAIVLTANSDGYRAALDLHSCCVQVRAVIDLRHEGETSDLQEEVRAAGIRVLAGYAVLYAEPAADKAGITGARICPLGTSGLPQINRAFTIGCDGIAMSVGWAPADGLIYQGGGRMVYSQRLEQFVPAMLPPGMFAAGRVNGIYHLEDQLADGERAGLVAAAHLGLYEGKIPPEPCHDGPPPSHPYPIMVSEDAKCFVDLDEDVQYKDFVHAAQEGFDHVELMKRYSTFGMGPSQGKLSNVNAIRILAKIRGQSIAETGTTTSRPFFHPVPLSHLAGRGFHPHRQTALHSWHAAAGAVFMPAGEWLRPAYYLGGELGAKSREQAISEEVLAVRRGIAMIDVGTLGKIEISGPDAGEFIERIYTARFAKMKIGTSRYGLMCDESGVIIDDGVIARLGQNRFYATTTTTSSGNVYRELQRWALLWGLEVVLVNATGSYCAMNLAGPYSREILQKLTPLDLREEAFPYLGAREGEVLGVPVRLFRVGFVGELGYEIHVPSHSARYLWEGIMEAGRERSIRPFGVEAQRILRLEKAHVIVGQDTDGLTTPREAKMSWAVKMDKPFFVGQRSLQIHEKKPLERVLVGFALPRGYSGPVPQECHLVIENNKIMGRVTSIAYSPTLRRVIGLAYVPPHKEAIGSEFDIRIDDGTLVRATVVETPFYDPENLRQSSEAQPYA
jgi:sarcosine oxidase subunit alpha